MKLISLYVIHNMWVFLDYIHQNVDSLQSTIIRLCNLKKKEDKNVCSNYAGIIIFLIRPLYFFTINKNAKHYIILLVLYNISKLKTISSLSQVYKRIMIFAHIFLPAILLAICKAQPYYDNSQQSFTPDNERLSIDEYRRLAINSIMQMKDSCRVYDYLLDVDKKWIDDDGKLEGNKIVELLTVYKFSITRLL